MLASLKSQVRAARLRAHRVVNTELLTLYWTIDHAIYGAGSTAVSRVVGWVVCFSGQGDVQLMQPLGETLSAQSDA